MQNNAKHKKYLTMPWKCVYTKNTNDRCSKLLLYTTLTISRESPLIAEIFFFYFHFYFYLLFFLFFFLIFRHQKRTVLLPPLSFYIVLCDYFFSYKALNLGLMCNSVVNFCQLRVPDYIQR